MVYRIRNNSHASTTTAYMSGRSVDLRQVEHPSISGRTDRARPLIMRRQPLDVGHADFPVEDHPPLVVGTEGLGPSYEGGSLLGRLEDGLACPERCRGAGGAE